MAGKIGNARLVYAAFWRRLGAFVKRKMREPEGGCRKCAICHHVCQLLEKKRPEREE